MNDLEMRRAQAHLYERVVRGDSDIELLFQKYKDLLDMKITMGTTQTCICLKFLESHPLRHENALNEGLNIVLGDITRGKCRCRTEDQNQSNRVSATISLVHAAAGFGHIKILSLLNKYRCDMNAKTTSHKTPLYYAVKNRQLDVIDFLLGIGVDVNVLVYPEKYTALHEAVHLRYMDVVNKLLTVKNLKINIKNTKGESPLVHAVRIHFYEAFESLLEAGAKCDVQDEKGNTALMMAVIRGMDYVRPLIKKGANLNIKNKRNQTALSFALHLLMAEDTEMVCYLVENGADPNVTGDDGNPPIVLSSIAGAFDVAQKLIKHGAEVTSKNAQGYNALHVAAWNGYTDIVDLLLKTGMEHDTRTNDGNTPLSLAAHGDHLEVINMLLPLGCNVNNVDKDEDTPLLYATFNSNLKMVCKLVNAGADPDCRNHHNTTPLWNAVYKNDQDTIRYLLVKNVELEVSSRGIDQHAQSDVATVIYPVPRSLLYVAALQCSVDVVMTLILAGYNIYREQWVVDREFPYDSSPLLRRMLINFSSSPPRLLALCRVFFRRRFKGNLEENVSFLDIPGNLKNNLMLKNLIPEEFFKM